jgi:hypothetical protein
MNTNQAASPAANRSIDFNQHGVALSQARWAGPFPDYQLDWPAERPGNNGNARQRQCPSCRALIYSRRHKLCGVCGEALPAELLFSGVEVRRIEALLQRERLAHRAWMHKV